MASLLFTAEALDDMDRLEDFLGESDPALAASTPGLILRALAILEQHPYMGQPLDGGLRQLVISRGRTGYVALYRYREDIDMALVLAIRHQRQAGLSD